MANFFQRTRVKHVAAEVTGLREVARCVETAAGDVRNAALVILRGLFHQKIAQY